MKCHSLLPVICLFVCLFVRLIHSLAHSLSYFYLFSLSYSYKIGPPSLHRALKGPSIFFSDVSVVY